MYTFRNFVTLKSFLQRDHQGFLKDVEVWLIDKTQAFFSNFFSIFFQTTQQKHYLK